MHKASLLVGLILASVCPWAEQGAAQTAKRSAAATPAPRFAGEDQVRSLEYIKDHERRVKALAARPADVLFLGDSITQAWSGEGKEVWQKWFAPLKAANIGSSGDCTQHALWRIVNGEFRCQPKVAVVMIGTNNQFYDPADAITEGVTEVVQAIRKESPKTRVLLMSILPRGKKLPNPLNDKTIAVNKEIAKLADAKTIWFINIYAKYLEGGQPRKELFIDDTHLSAKGYEVWADAITPLLKELVARN
jgi:lysophospholipase L1-like esterase